MRYTEIKKIKFLASTDISEACLEAINFAIDNNCIVEFKFNGVLLKAGSHTTVEILTKEYTTRLNASLKLSTTNNTKEKQVYIISATDTECDFYECKEAGEIDKIKARARQTKKVYTLRNFQYCINNEHLDLEDSFILID